MDRRRRAGITGYSLTADIQVVQRTQLWLSVALLALFLVVMLIFPKAFERVSAQCESFLSASNKTAQRGADEAKEAVETCLSLIFSG